MSSFEQVEPHVHSSAQGHASSPRDAFQGQAAGPMLQDLTSCGPGKTLRQTVPADEDAKPHRPEGMKRLFNKSLKKETVNDEKVTNLLVKLVFLHVLAAFLGKMEDIY